MRQRLGITVLFALLATLLVATPAKAVDTTPPPVGSCHDLTIEEAYSRAEPDPAVDCATRHTTVTIKIIRFKRTPDWSNHARLHRKVVKKCGRNLLAYFDGRIKKVSLSAYAIYWFYPTKKQRNAGAKWLRCDLALIRPKSVPTLPTDGDPRLGRLPLSDDVAKCRKGKRKNYFPTTCNTGHRLRATHAVRYRSDTYPGDAKMERRAWRKCNRKLGRSLGYAEWPLRLNWKAGYRHVVCYKKTRN